MMYGPQNCKNDFLPLLLLGRFTALTGSYRRFETAYRSHIQGSSSLNCFSDVSGRLSIPSSRIKQSCVTKVFSTDRLFRNVGNYQ